MRVTAFHTRYVINSQMPRIVLVLFLELDSPAQLHAERIFDLILVHGAVCSEL